MEEATPPKKGGRPANPYVHPSGRAIGPSETELAAGGVGLVLSMAPCSIEFEQLQGDKLIIKDSWSLLAGPTPKRSQQREGCPWGRRIFLVLLCQLRSITVAGAREEENM
jgi:hypothetical protein